MKKLSWCWRLGLLAGLAFLVYSPAIRGGFIWDDDAYVTSNVALKTLKGLWDIWFRPFRLDQYYPMTYTSFWINYHLGGLDPLGYHIVNVLLHTLNGLLVWRLLERLKVPGAWFACLLFLLYPVNVESVAWITERKNVLSGFFYLSAFLSYLRFKEEQARPWRWYFISLALFLGALFSKTVTGTFPVAVLLILWWKEDRFPRRDLVRLVPFFVCAAVLSTITMAFENGHLVKFGIAEWTFSPADRFLIAGRALWFYLGKLLWPHPSTLMFTYPRWAIDPSVLWQWSFPLSFILLLFVLWRFRSRWGRGPLTSLAFFTLTLFPALGFRSFFPMRFSFVADHFQYLATIGPIACAVALAWTVLGKHPRTRITLGIVLLVLFGAFSWKQCGIYKDLETLWRDTIAKNPGSWMAHNNLGMVLLQSDRKEEAAMHFNESLRLKPNMAEAYSNMGLVLTGQGDLKKSVDYHLQAVRLRPNSADFQNNLGAAFFSSGMTEEAIDHYLKAAELDPGSVGPRYNLGIAFLKKGDLEKAVHWCREAITREPGYTDTEVAFGLALSAIDREKESFVLFVLYSKALALDPKDATSHNHLANLLASKSLLDKAEHHFREAIRLAPDSVLFRNSFASFLSSQGKSDEAISQYNEVLRLDPKDPEAQRALLQFALGLMSEKSRPQKITASPTSPDAG